MTFASILLTNCLAVSLSRDGPSKQPFEPLDDLSKEGHGSPLEDIMKSEMLESGYKSLVSFLKQLNTALNVATNVVVSGRQLAEDWISNFESTGSELVSGVDVKPVSQFIASLKSNEGDSRRGLRNRNRMRSRFASRSE